MRTFCSNITFTLSELRQLRTRSVCSAYVHECSLHCFCRCFKMYAFTNFASFETSIFFCPWLSSHGYKTTSSCVCAWIFCCECMRRMSSLGQVLDQRSFSLIIVWREWNQHWLPDYLYKIWCSDKSRVNLINVYKVIFEVEQMIYNTLNNIRDEIYL